MKLILTTGCTAYDFTVDGRSIVELSDKEENNLLDIVVTRLKNKLGAQIILQELVNCFGDYDVEEGHCEQCGDSVSHTELEL